MTVVVTGATGFIGSRLVRRLRADGWQVHGLGRGAAPQDIPWLRHDLLDEGPIALPPETETVFHLAFAHLDDSGDRATMRRLNVSGTRRMLEAAAAVGATRFVLASTGGVYGYQPHPLRETDPVRPIDDYSASKAEAEEVATTAEAGPDVTILRLFFPYGAGQRGRLVPGLVQRILHGEEVALHPGGRPRINPIHVSDAIDVCVAALARPGGRIVNVAGPEVTDIGRLAASIGAILDRPVRTAERLPPVDDLVADISNLEATLGIRPRTDLDTGLREAVAEHVASEVV